MIHDYHTQYNNKKVTYQFSKYGSLPFLFPFQHSGSKKLSWMSSIPFLYFTLVISSYLQVAMAADWWISWIFKAICLIIINKFQVHQEKGIQVVSVNYIQAALEEYSDLPYGRWDETSPHQTLCTMGGRHSLYFTTSFFYTDSDHVII